LRRPQQVRQLAQHGPADLLTPARPQERQQVLRDLLRALRPRLGLWLLRLALRRGVDLLQTVLVHPSPPALLCHLVRQRRVVTLAPGRVPRRRAPAPRAVRLRVRAPAPHSPCPCHGAHLLVTSSPDPPTLYLLGRA